MTDSGPHGLGEQGRHAPPWRALPPEVAAGIAPHLGALAEVIIDEIQAGVPSYSRPLEGDFGDAVRRGVEVALRRLLIDLPGTREPGLTPSTRKVYRNLGRGEARAGRPLEALLSAYRIGARVAFREAARVTVDQGLAAPTLLALGESIFVYIDEVSAASIEAFTDEQATQVGERDRRRATLLERLVSGRSDEAELRAMAAAASWVIPTEVVVAVLPVGHAEGLRLAMGEDVLLRTRNDQVIALLSAPSTERARADLERALEGRRAWVGPVRPWLRAGTSLQAAMTGAALQQQPGVASGQGGPWWVDQHLADLVLGQGSDLMEELADQRLAPLDRLRDNQRTRLVETLLAWLDHRGERTAVAAALGIHPQTVGYRVAQLREVYGDLLDDPQVRFELHLVLRAGYR